MSGSYAPYTMADVAMVEGTNGLTVASKASALDGTMVPYSRERNAEMVEAVFGIRPVEFWRVLNFSASVVVVE